MNLNRSSHKLALSITASIMAACGAQAYDVPLTSINTNLPPIDFHGFISQGFLKSSDYNYLGDTKAGSFQFTEMGINAAFDPFPRTHIAIQGFDYDVGDVGQYQPFLDYASAEYTFNDYVGVRAGRVRRPNGIYNSIQDIDLARTSVLLPQGVYDCRWRDFSASIDGVDIFGNVSLDKAGSLSYEVYAGFVNMTDNGGVARNIQNGLPPAPIGGFDGMDQCEAIGSQLWYNTPVNGLRVGLSGGYIENFGYKITIAPPYGPGDIQARDNIPFGMASVEYIWKSWTFQSEYFSYNVSGNQYAFDARVPISYSSTQTEAWYVGAAYRFNKKFEVGTYYTEYYGDVSQMDNSQQFQKDVALSFRYDPTDWWVLKIEGHLIHGTGLLQDNAVNPVRDQNDNAWFMLALKTTFSF